MEDTDGDGIPDYLDEDADGNGILDEDDSFDLEDNGIYTTSWHFMYIYFICILSTASNLVCVWI